MGKMQRIWRWFESDDLRTDWFVSTSLYFLPAIPVILQTAASECNEIPFSEMISLCLKTIKSMRWWDTAVSLVLWEMERHGSHWCSERWRGTGLNVLWEMARHGSHWCSERWRGTGHTGALRDGESRFSLVLWEMARHVLLVLNHK